MSDGQGEGSDQSQLPMKGIKDPQDTDVLGGRGGAALRHPGNQAYRRLVHLNKGLYITCLKAEKLKISRSIVAAIREQGGRFLERDSKTGTWYDIGDKKAMEKTSQALREGQPKLRQKIVELGGGPAGAAALLEAQFPGNTLYNLQQQPASNSNLSADNPLAAAAAAAVSATAAAAAGGTPQQQLDQALMNERLISLSRGNSASSVTQAAAQQQAVLGQLAMAQGSSRSNLVSNISTRSDISADLMSKLSLTGEGVSTIQEDPGGQIYPALTTRGTQIDLAVDPTSTLSLMSDFSQFNGSTGILTPAGSQMSLQRHRNSLLAQQIIASPGVSQSTMAGVTGVGNQDVVGSMPSIGSRSLSPNPASTNVDVATGMTDSTHGVTTGKSRPDAFGKLDRRRMFARMKYSRPPSGRFHKGQVNASNRSLGDGMPDIHLVESNPSIFSNMSSVDDEDGVEPKVKPSSKKKSVTVPDVANVFESRRSLMSGLSKISDASEVNSIFSDLSRKIGNVSTRSIAMSEISQMDHTDDLEEDEVDELVAKAGVGQSMEYDM